MKNLKKVVVLLLASLIMVGCSTNGSGNENTNIVTEITEPVEITFWHAMNGAQEEALVKLTEEFMAANENITVTLQNQSSYKDLQQKITSTLISPDNLPNITQSYPGSVFDAAAEGLVEPITPYINNDAIGIADYESDVIESFRNAGVFNGVAYGIPFSKSSEVIFYNKTIFDELKIKVPTNLEEFKAATEKITAEKPDVVGAGFDSLKNYYSTFMNSEGIAFNAEIDPAGAASEKAVSYYLDGIKGGYFRIAGSDVFLSGPFGAEKVAMSVGSTAGESYIRKGAEGKFEVGATKLPFESTIQQGPDIFMFSNGTPQQKTASFLYMKHLISAESTLYWAQTTGYLPVRKSVIESATYKESDSLIAPMADIITADMFTLPVIKNSNSAYDEVEVQMETILSSTNVDLKTALENFKTALDAIWSE